ncbi:hypothetical protein ACFL53_00390 [Pseudomonadota bacterium]
MTTRSKEEQESKKLCLEITKLEAEIDKLEEEIIFIQIKRKALIVTVIFAGVGVLLQLLRLLVKP